MHCTHTISDHAFSIFFLTQFSKLHYLLHVALRTLSVIAPSNSCVSSITFCLQCIFAQVQVLVVLCFDNPIIPMVINSYSFLLLSSNASTIVQSWNSKVLNRFIYSVAKILYCLYTVLFFIKKGRIFEEFFAFFFYHNVYLNRGFAERPCILPFIPVSRGLVSLWIYLSYRIK